MSPLGRGTTVNMFVGNAILNKYVLISFTKGGYSFRIFYCNVELKKVKAVLL